MTTEPTHDPERERAGAAALASLRSELQTPARLRARVESERSRRTRSWRIPALAGATAAMAAALLFLVVLGGGPSIEQAGGLAAQGPDAPAPATSPGGGALLAGSFEGLAHPNWEPEFGWRASGELREDLDGRETRTVFYDKQGERIAYTIVGGEALDVPGDADVTEIEGVEFAAFRDEGRNVVTWTRDGHTCVLAGAGVDTETLVELAAWRGDGAVAF